MDNGIKPELIAPKKKRTNPDRAAIAPDVLERLKAWHRQISTHVKGLKVTTNDLLNWKLRTLPSELSANELQQLKAEFFDEVKFAEWIARELRAAKARGENITLAELMQTGGAIDTPKQRKPREKRPDKTLSVEQPSAPSGLEESPSG